MRAFVKTFGCQQNVRDSETAAGLLVAAGCALTESARDADVIFINTCAVRAHAENKVLSYLGRLKDWREAKSTRRLVVCGCMAAQSAVAAKLKEQFPQVDIIIGPDALPKLAELLRDSQNDGRRVVDIDENIEWPTAMPVVRGAPERPAKQEDGRREALVTIMLGCNNFCSYCIVPYVRGRERSRNADEILREITTAVGEGYDRIMLLGQNVNAYRDGDLDFPKLLRKINALDGDFTVRFMTSHPKDADAALFSAIAECDRVEKHLHLPVQSGSSAVLAAMNRKYTREEYLAKIDALRALVPDIRLSSDIIVGYPGERDEDFEDTLSLVEYVGYNQLFTFLFSPRKGTPAAEAAVFVPEGVKKERFARLLEVQRGVEESGK